MTYATAVLLARLLLPVTVAASAGCQFITGPGDFLPKTAIRLTPLPDSYPSWWKQIEACSGKSRRMREVQWYVVPDSMSFDGRAAQTIGGDVIVIAGKRLQSGGFVRHEMLHALGVRGHPEEYFVTRCGGLVYR